VKRNDEDNTKNVIKLTVNVKIIRNTTTHAYIGWWRGPAVTRWSRSTKLLYAMPG